VTSGLARLGPAMRDTGPTLASLAADPRLLDAVPPERVPRILRECAALALALASRIQDPVTRAEPAPAPEPEKWVTAGQVAEAFSLSLRQVRSLARRESWRPYVRRLNGRTTRYGLNGLRRLLEAPGRTSGT
jgi:hypothetical protein